MRAQTKWTMAREFSGIFSRRINIAEPVHPTVGAFHHPPTGLEPFPTLDGPRLFAAGANARRATKLQHQVPDVVEIAALLQAQPLPAPRPRFRPLHGRARRGGLRRFHVVPVGPVHRDADGNPSSFTRQASLDAALGSVRWIRPGFFPRPTAPSSSPHPSTATAIGTPSIRHIPRAPASTACGTRLSYAAPGTAGGPWSCRKSPSRSKRSTGIPREARKKPRPGPGDLAPKAARQGTDPASSAWATAVRPFSKELPEPETTEISPSSFRPPVSWDSRLRSGYGMITF